jgi:hypothetical protein
MDPGAANADEYSEVPRSPSRMSIDMAIGAHSIFGALQQFLFLAGVSLEAYCTLRIAAFFSVVDCGCRNLLDISRDFPFEECLYLSTHVHPVPPLPLCSR